MPAAKKRSVSRCVPVPEIETVVSVNAASAVSLSSGVDVRAIPS
jgi:hypothetical protein